MNLFRSEEHVRNWAGFDPSHEEGILRLPELVKMFSANYFRRRIDPDWVPRRREYGVEWVQTLIELGKIGPFWYKAESRMSSGRQP